MSEIICLPVPLEKPKIQIKLKLREPVVPPLPPSPAAPPLPPPPASAPKELEKDYAIPEDYNSFMEKMLEGLINQVGLSSLTAFKYMSKLKTLNLDKKFSNLGFLNDFNNIEAILDMRKIKDSTRCDYYGACVAVLKLFSTKAYNERRKYFISKFEGIKRDVDLVREENKHELSQTQADNWVDWTVIEGLVDKINALPYNDRLFKAALSCYVFIDPRRCKDFTRMIVTTDDPSTFQSNRNYYHEGEQAFYFFDYKTDATHGEFRVDVPPELQKNLKAYLEVNPRYHQSELPRYLFVKKNGSPFFTEGPYKRHRSDNYWTRLLQENFKKHLGKDRISVNMLRAIYSSHKTPIKQTREEFEEYKRVCKGMSHTQRAHEEYVKFPPSPPKND